MTMTSSQNAPDPPTRRDAGADPAPDFVYGEFNDNLVFIETSTSAPIYELQTAVYGCETWGQLGALLSDDVVERFASLLRPCRDPDSADKPLEGDAIHAAFEAIWPEWAEQEMLYCIPPEIQETFGVRSSLDDGSEYLALPADEEEEILEAFAAADLVCKRDDRFVLEVTGYADEEEDED